MPEQELNAIFNQCIRRCFPYLDDIFALLFPLQGEAHEKYGDYVCENILIICERLRRLKHNTVHQETAQAIAQRLLQAVNDHPQSGMITKLRLHDVGFLTFRLSLQWMRKRIRRMLNEGGMDTWAPQTNMYPVVVVAGLAPDRNAYCHAEEVRFSYTTDMLTRLLKCCGVNVCRSYISVESWNAVRGLFTQKQGVIQSRNRKTRLFAVKGIVNAENFCEDLQTLWSAIFKLRAQAVIYVAPLRRCEYVKKCIDAAEHEKWLSVEWNPSVDWCGYRSSSDERTKLDRVWTTWDGHPKVESLVLIGGAVGYTREACVECAIKYAYLKTHRLAECTLNIDEMFDQEGNTFACLLKTRVLISSLHENHGGGGMVKKDEKVFLSKEHELALHLVQFPDVLRNACLSFSLHSVCEYTWILCKKFRSYYLEVMEFLDSKTYKSKFFLCDATGVVLQKCFDLLGITEISQRLQHTRFSQVKTGFEIFPYSPSVDPRPDKVNPRLEMFCMNIVVTDTSFKKGAVHGIVSVVDVDGLLADGRLPVNRNEQGHVAYFYHDWFDKIGIHKNAFVYFGSPSPCHTVSFSSATEVFARLFVTTDNKCYLMCNLQKPIKLPEFWGEKKLDHMRGTLTYEGDYGSVLIDYIALRDAVEVTMLLSFESPDPLKKVCVSGCIFAYYEGMLDDLDSFHQRFYKALIFKAPKVADNPLQVSAPAEFGTEFSVGPPALRKGVMAVPANGTLVLEACFYDKRGKLKAKSTEKFPAQAQGERKWLITLDKDCSLNLRLEWSKGPKSAYC